MAAMSDYFGCYCFLFSLYVQNASVRQLPSVGYHGYDNLRYPNMYGIFLASGPGMLIIPISSLSLKQN